MHATERWQNVLFRYILSLDFWSILTHNRYDAWIVRIACLCCEKHQEGGGDMATAITHVQPGSLAEKLGLHEGDQLVSIAGEPIIDQIGIDG